MKININKLTETEKRLYKMLTEIWTDNDFIIGTLNALEDDAEREEVIELIEHNDDVLPEQITLLSLRIDLARQAALKAVGTADGSTDSDKV